MSVSAVVGFREIADRVWVARYPWFDLNVIVVAGSRGAVVVDTHASEVAAREVVDDLSRVTAAGPVVAIVNTHEHFDHTFGNAAMIHAFGAVGVHAHEVAAARTVSSGDRVKQHYAADPDSPRREEVLATEIVPADRTFSSTAVLDLGDRQVELVHPGRGHTGGDVVVRVADADVVLAGDLVEESAPPFIGEDAYPLEWSGALDVVLGLVDEDSLVVPGHGAVVDRAFVVQQRADLGVVAETIRDLVERGVPVDDALDAAEWPWPRERLSMAVRRGYEQLTGQSGR